MSISVQERWCSGVSISVDTVFGLLGELVFNYSSLGDAVGLDFQPYILRFDGTGVGTRGV